MNKSTRPAASFDVLFNTFENSRYQRLPINTVTLKIENCIFIEVGGWGTNLRLTALPGTKVETEVKPDGKTVIRFTPSKRTKSSILTI